MMRSRYLALSALLAALSAAAETTSIEALLQVEVEGASRFAQPLAEAPSAVSVVTAEDIRRYGFRTLGEALSSMRGVYITDERDYSYVGIRGFARPGDYNTRMLLMTDGIRRNDPLYDTAYIGHEAPIEVDWVKRLEFVPGPASALYGANAIFGVANAVLLSGGDINGTRIRADAGSGRMGRVGVLSGARTDGGGEWLIGVSAYGRRGDDLYFRQYDDPATNNGVAQRLDGERYVKAIAKASFGNWQVDAGHSFRRRNVPTAYYDTAFNVPGNFITDSYSYADASYARSFGEDWAARLRLRAGRYEFRGEYVLVPLNRDEAETSWLGADYEFTYTGLRDHKLLIGGDVQHEHIHQANFDLAPRVDKLDDRRDVSRSGIFVQDEWRMAPDWIANFGVRADRNGGFDMTSPRAALIHRLTPATTLKLIYGKAFRPPNAYERYYTDGGVFQKLNPDLKPERITTKEIVADYAASSVLRLSASYYRYRITDLIDQIEDPADNKLVFVNRPGIDAQGVEFETEAVLPKGLHVKASVARQRVEQDFGPAVNSPKWLGKLLIDGPLCSTGWNLGLNLQAIDRRNTPAGQVPGYGTGSLVLTQDGSRAWGRWSVGVYNLAGRRHLDPASSAVAGGTVPQDRRQVRVGWELAL